MKPLFVVMFYSPVETISDMQREVSDLQSSTGKAHHACRHSSVNGQHACNHSRQCVLGVSFTSLSRGHQIFDGDNAKCTVGVHRFGLWKQTYAQKRRSGKASSDSVQVGPENVTYRGMRKQKLNLFSSKTQSKNEIWSEVCSLIGN